MKKYTEEYAMWLEDSLFKVLTKSKQISDEDLRQKAKNANIEYIDEFVGHLLEINKEHRLRATVEFLDTFPVSLCADGYYEDEEQKVHKWEIDVIFKLFSRLEKENKHITDKVYLRFFEEVMKKYKPYFLDYTYTKILPENVFAYWFYRIDKSIPWCEISNHPENIAVDLTALIESGYLNTNKPMSDYEHMKNNPDC